MRSKEPGSSENYRVPILEFSHILYSPLSAQTTAASTSLILKIASDRFSSTSGKVAGLQQPYRRQVASFAR
jgi:hypothetical protein